MNREGRTNLTEVGRYRWWQRWLLYPIARNLAWLMFLILGPLSVRGRYRIPKHGPVLILPNHMADVDPIVVQIASSRPIQFMAKSELFEMGALGRILRWFRVFPVKRGEPDRAAIRHAIETLKLGEAVGVFPEGQLSETGELQEVKAGVALIIRQAAVDRPLPVICCGLKNTNQVMPYGRVLPRISLSRVLVEWGEVREFTRDSPAAEVLEWVTTQLRELTS